MSRRAVLVSALLLCAALAGAAHAALTTKTDSVTLAVDEVGSASARCGDRAEVVSGGFRNPGFDYLAPTAPAIWTFESRREGRRSVVATGNNDGTVSGDLIAYAYCDRGGRALTTESRSTPVEFGEDASATARCGRGSRAIWGGFEMGDQSSLPLLVLGSHRDGRRGWTASGVTYDDKATLDVFAYCLRNGPRLTEVRDSTRLGSDEAGSATAKCERGTEAVSGGFLAPGGFSTDGGAEIYFFESRRIRSRKWRTSGLNQGDPARLTAVAYCTRH